MSLKQEQKTRKGLLVLCKRQYTGKDLLSDRFGRCWELPRELARLGYSVTGVALSYRKRDTGNLVERHPEGGGDLEWYSVNLGLGVIPGLITYFRLVSRIVREQKPVAIMAMSDAPHIVMGRFFARRFGVKLIADLYDNFESFGLTRLPGLPRAFSSSVKNADAVICVSSSLAEFVGHSYGREQKIGVIGNAANREWFRPMNRKECRDRFDLPTDKKLIGTMGALSHTRDIETLFRAADRLAARYPEVELVVAGPRDQNLTWPANIKVHDLGLLPQQEIAYVINALDVAIVCNRDSDFGRYCFPQKIAEILACDIPLVAAETGVAKELLSHKPACLYRPADVAVLEERIETQLQEPVRPAVSLDDWGELARKLDKEFRKWKVI